MDLAKLSIGRPTFITCIVILMIAAGIQSMRSLGVDLFPDVTFPVVTVSVPYPGAGPSEMETLVSKPLEEELSTISGVKRLSSISQEGVSTVVAEFTLETDIKFAEQQIRDRVGSAKRRLPLDIREPVIRRIDPADQPILILALDADLPPAKLFDLADEKVKPKLQQIGQVGLVEILGGRKREIRVELDQTKLKQRELSATQVASRLGLAGENVPAGKVDVGGKELVFRTVAQFNSLDDIKNAVVSFIGNDVPVTVGEIAKVTDGLEDQKSLAYVNGKQSLFLYVFRQSGANTIAVVDAVKKALDKINSEIAVTEGAPKLTVVRDGSFFIRANVYDVYESIAVGTILAILVVYLFLANGRSTFITGLALPNSLIGAFILMALAGFSINIMSLLALSLAVGLLVDDAIVVRENIFRHIEMGKDPVKASYEGTMEVQLAVIATTLVVIAVFGPVGFLKGVVGQFFKQFGLTMCFAMAISLFDALTIAPMLSAYFAGKNHGIKTTGIWGSTVGRGLLGFSKFQDWLENVYEKVLRRTVRAPWLVLGIGALIFGLSFWVLAYVPKTFLPTQDNGEFNVGLDLPPGTSLEEMRVTALKVDEVIRANKEVEVAAITVGSRDAESNVATIYVRLVKSKERSVTTSQFKERLRGQLTPFKFANPVVKDYDAVGGGLRPFTVNIVGFDQAELERVSLELLEKLKTYPGLKDVDVNFRPGKPEFQFELDSRQADQVGLLPVAVGQELRTLIEGATPAKFREEGREYDVRVRLREEQRNLQESFERTYVPNINGLLVPLKQVAKPIEAAGSSKINRQDRARYIQVAADIAPGAGLAQIMTDVSRLLEKDIGLPPGLRYVYVGQAENFQELIGSMAVALGFGILFIYLVLASLYESFVTPFTIMLALPLAICGSFYGLGLANETLNLFSMIGTIMLLGIATKNSILLVDYANQLVQKGESRDEAIIKAGRTRLRPILMTSMALIAGAIPIAIGLNEASKQRTSMGVAIIGGLVSSTLLTLVVVPAAYSYMDRFRVWSRDLMKALFAPHA